MTASFFPGNPTHLPSRICFDNPCLPSTAVETADKSWAVVARGIRMAYPAAGNSVEVLKGVDFRVRQGDVQLLMGPSGSGKTTLLSILGGMLTPSEGRVCLLGQDITRLSRRKLSRFRLGNIGFIFQGFNLFPALTARENVEVALNLKGIRGRIARHLAQHLLDRVGLGAKSGSLPNRLSGGEKQRVAIARALADSPPLIFADEPTASLDAHSGRAVVELLRSLAKEQGSTILIVTHDPRILDIADATTYMEDGCVRDRPGDLMSVER